MGGVLKSRVLTLLVLACMIGFSQIPLVEHNILPSDEEFPAKWVRSWSNRPTIMESW